jgi:hypothetical protein
MVAVAPTELLAMPNDDELRGMRANATLKSKTAGALSSSMETNLIAGEQDLSAQGARINPGFRAPNDLIPVPTHQSAKKEPHQMELDKAERELGLFHDPAVDLLDIANSSQPPAKQRTQPDTTMDMDKSQTGSLGFFPRRSVQRIKVTKVTPDATQTSSLAVKRPGRGKFLPQNAIAVIVNRQNLQSINQRQLRDIYLDRLSNWKNGKMITVYNLPVSTAARELFSRQVLNMSALDAATMESNRKITNRQNNSLQTRQQNVILHYVANDPQAIGYVPLRLAQDNDQVRVLFTLGGTD